MLDLTLQTYLTLDGVYQAPGGPDEDKTGGFKHGGWMLPFHDEAGHEILDKQWQETKAMLMGRKTYDIFAGFWPTTTEAPVISKLFNTIPKYVASRKMKKAVWKGTTVIGSDLAKEIAAAKQQDGPGIFYIPGSGHLAQTLMTQNLIDEYRLWIFPILLGTGKRLFADGVVPANLKLVDSKTTGSGVAVLTYRAKT